MGKRGIVVLGAVLILAGNLLFATMLDPYSVSSTDGDERTFLAYVAATGKESLLFPEIAGYCSPARSAALAVALLRNGTSQPRFGGAFFVSYSLLGTAVRCCDSYLAIKLWPILIYTLVYVGWARFTAALFPRFVLAVVTLFFLFPPFNLRYSFLYINETHNLALLFGALVAAAVAGRRGRAPRLGTAALLAGLGFACCVKNLVEAAALVLLGLFLARRGELPRRRAALALALFLLAYVPLPLLLVGSGFSPVANLTDRTNLSPAGSWGTAAAIAADLQNLRYAVSRAFVYQIDLTPGRFFRGDLLYPAAIAAAALLWVLSLRFGRDPRSPARFYLLAATALGVLFYLLSPVRIYAIDRITADTSFRYFASLYPPAFIFLGWLADRIRRGVRAGAGGRRAVAALLLAALFLRPAVSTVGQIVPLREGPRSYQLRAVQFAPLGWVLGKAAPRLDPAEAERRIVGLAERPDDVPVIARDYFRFVLYTRPMSDAELQAYAAPLRQPGVRLGLAGALGCAAAGALYPNPESFLDPAPVVNRYDWGRLAAALPPDEAAEFWRGVGWADPTLIDHATRYDRTSNPELAAAAAARVPAAARNWYLEGVGEAMVHNLQRYSLRYLNYDYYFDVRTPERVVAGFPDELRRPLLAGIRRAAARFLLAAPAAG